MQFPRLHISSRSSIPFSEQNPWTLDCLSIGPCKSWRGNPGMAISTWAPQLATDDGAEAALAYLRRVFT